MRSSGVLPGTDEVHEAFVDIGTRLGFTVKREDAQRTLIDRGPGEYAPTPDVVWSKRLTRAQAAALTTATGLPFGDVLALPIAGVEVEGSDASTKVMQADVMNIAALRLPLGFLVVNEDYEAGVYRRAARVVRTLRRTLGEATRTVLPLEVSWVRPLESLALASAPQELPRPRRTKARGGEKQLAERARAHFSKLGASAGFVVVENYKPPLAKAWFTAARSRRAEPLTHLYSPRTGERKKMTRAGDYITASEVDMAWLLPLPLGLRELLEKILELDPSLAEHDLVFPDLWESLAVVGFEFEKSNAKHAAGGFVNLSTHFAYGVMVPTTERAREAQRRMRETYARTMGIDSVSVFEGKF